MAKRQTVGQEARLSTQETFTGVADLPNNALFGASLFECRLDRCKRSLAKAVGIDNPDNGADVAR